MADLQPDFDRSGEVKAWGLVRLVKTVFAFAGSGVARVVAQVVVVVLAALAVRRGAPKG